MTLTAGSEATVLIVARDVYRNIIRGANSEPLSAALTDSAGAATGDVTQTIQWNGDKNAYELTVASTAAGAYSMDIMAAEASGSVSILQTVADFCASKVAAGDTACSEATMDVFGISHTTCTWTAEVVTISRQETCAAIEGETDATVTADCQAACATSTAATCDNACAIARTTSARGVCSSLCSYTLINERTGSAASCSAKAAITVSVLAGSASQAGSTLAWEANAEVTDVLTVNAEATLRLTVGDKYGNVLRSAPESLLSTLTAALRGGAGEQLAETLVVAPTAAATCTLASRDERTDKSAWTEQGTYSYQTPQGSTCCCADYCCWNGCEPALMAGDLSAPPDACIADGAAAGATWTQDGSTGYWTARKDNDAYSLGSPQDNGDGTYSWSFESAATGAFSTQVTFFSKTIPGSPGSSGSPRLSVIAETSVATATTSTTSATAAGRDLSTATGDGAVRGGFMGLDLTAQIKLRDGTGNTRASLEAVATFAGTGVVTGTITFTQSSPEAATAIAVDLTNLAGNGPYPWRVYDLPCGDVVDEEGQLFISLSDSATATATATSIDLPDSPDVCLAFVDDARDVPLYATAEVPSMIGRSVVLLEQAAGSGPVRYACATISQTKTLSASSTRVSHFPHPATHTANVPVLSPTVCTAGC